MPAHLTVGRYIVDIEPNEDREGVNCYVTSPCGRYHNSLACLEGEGRFDDGPAISDADLDRIRAVAERHGY